MVTKYHFCRKNICDVIQDHALNSFVQRMVCMLCKHGKKAVKCWSSVKTVLWRKMKYKSTSLCNIDKKHFFFYLLSPLATLKSCEMAKTRRRKKFLLCSRAGFDSFFFNIIGCISWTSVEQSQHGFGLIQKFLVVSFCQLWTLTF